MDSNADVRNAPIVVPIRSDADIVTARQEGRALASQAGFRGSEPTLIATAISELARNILEYAKTGEIRIDLLTDGLRRGIVVVADDEGPGIADIDRALQDGYSTGKGLGLGLPGTKRLMDELTIASEPGKGARIVVKKWVR